MQKTNKIWLNGKLVPWNEANTHILSHALHYGTAAFEGIRFYNTKKGSAIFRLDEHIDRFLYSIKVLRINNPYKKDQLKNAIIQTIKESKLNFGYIRPIAFFGYKNLAVDPKGTSSNVAIAVYKWDPFLGNKEIKVKISDLIRIHPKSLITDAKISGHYVNSILSIYEAQDNGFDECLLLDYNGNVAEGPAENFFMVKDNKLITPKKDNIFPGITRDSIIQLAKNNNIKIEEKDIKVDELLQADEAFFCGTGCEITPIKQINNTILKQNSLTKKLKELYKNFNQNWLTYINP